MALALHKFPSEIEVMDADDFRDLRLYLAESPLLSFWEAWKMVGMLCATVHNAWSKTPRRPDWFMPKLQKRPEKDD